MDQDSLQSLKDHVNSLSPISDTIWEELRSIMYPRKLKKNESIVSENQLFNKEIFIHQGIIRGFYTSKEGLETNTVFYQDRNLVCPYFARTREGRSIISLQAITPVIIFESEQHILKSIRHKYQELLLYSSLVVEQELERRTKHELIAITKDAEERYVLFRKMYPGLENRISQYHIASFLGITPVSLSRLRRQIVTKQNL